jgi:Secretory lipase
MLRRTSLLAGLLILTTSTLASTHAATGASPRPLPAKDSFYRYTGHKPLAKIAPGTILRKRTVSVALGSSATPISADQLLYRTKNELGQPSVTVTTVISSPAALVAPHILAYLSFYDALGSKCDPSFTLAGGYPGSSNQSQAQLEEGLIATYFGQGYVVTVPDFEGETLDWASGQEAGWDTLDGIRATETDLGLKRSTEVGLSGYSGGSIAADWASELAPHYAKSLHIVGVAEGGIPVDMAHNTPYINGSHSWSGVIPAVLDALTRAFHKNLSHFLSAKGRRITHAVRNQCIGSFLGSYPGLKIQSLLKAKYANFLAVPTFRRIVNKLLMGTAKGHPKGPLFMAVGNADGTGDGVMVTKDVEGLAHEYCKQGVPVQFTAYTGANHDEAAVQFEPAADLFLQDRFNGVPFVNGCSSVGKGNSLKPLHHKKH